MFNFEDLLVTLIAPMSTDLVPVGRTSESGIPKLVHRRAVTPAG